MQRKKFEVETDPNEVKEHEGFKLGDTVYCLRFPDNAPSRGVITKIHLGESVGAYHTFICDATGQFRKALFTTTTSEPDSKLRSGVEKIISKVRRQDAAHAAKLKEKEK